MRQARKLEILNFIDSLHQAHGEIKEAIEKREIASAQVMLVECQDFAVELGNAIEETEGGRLYHSLACGEILRDSFFVYMKS